MKPTHIIKREKPKPHYELHFNNKVEYWTLQGKKLGESKVQTYSDGDSITYHFTNRDASTGWKNIF